MTEASARGDDACDAHDDDDDDWGIMICVKFSLLWFGDTFTVFRQLSFLTLQDDAPRSSLGSRFGLTLT